MMREKEAYQHKADGQLSEWQAWIDQYRKDPTITGHLKPEDHDRFVERLEDNYRVARIRLEELRACQEHRWELSKQALERAMIDLKRALDESGAAQKARLLTLQTSRAHAYDPFPRRG